ncbi:MAG: PQQ-binding-like beta-propeller repeat protein [Tenuifilaceae bacterium]
MRIFTLLLTFLFFSHSSLFSQVISEWRGIGRTGVYNETGLLKEWPAGGPNLLWSIENLPKGNSSVAVAHNMLFATGVIDGNDVLVAMDLNGSIKWQKTYGRAWAESYPESRCIPTIDGNWIYVSSGYGDLACINAMNGEFRWTRKASEEYHGTYGRWGLAESLLIVGDKVFFTTGGGKTAMIALDKATGKTIWTTESLNDAPSYTSPIMIERGGKKIVVNVTTNYIFGVSVEDGKILWKFDFGSYAEQRNNNINSPTYSDGFIHVTSGYNHKSVMLKLSDDATSVSLAWVDSVLDVHHGGVVKVGDYIYGSNWTHNTMGNWVCLDWKTGKVMYEKTWINKGSIIAADGLLYCYEEKSGNIALVKPTPDDFVVISSFKITKGSGPHWAHPVINNGVLYVRHGEALMAFDILKK